jgi:hypothetical protein
MMTSSHDLVLNFEYMIIPIEFVHRFRCLFRSLTAIQYSSNLHQVKTLYCIKSGDNVMMTTCLENHLGIMVEALPSLKSIKCDKSRNAAQNETPCYAILNQITAKTIQFAFLSYSYLRPKLGTTNP